VIYLDTSALVKLVFEEAESEALATWMADRADVTKVSSEIAAIELVRACRRVDDDAVGPARQLLAGMDLVRLGVDVVERASLVGPVELSSPEAVHLASALAIGDALHTFVAYDARLREATAHAVLAVAAPV
jgi:predicted nucleic acid-binding protein